MQMIDQVLDHMVASIFYVREARRLSLKRIAIGAGLHPNSFRNLGRRDSEGRHIWSPSPHTLRKLETLLFTDRVNELTPARNGRRTPAPLAAQPPA